MYLKISCIKGDFRNNVPLFFCSPKKDKWEEKHLGDFENTL
jgi:hypothetical protein